VGLPLFALIAPEPGHTHRRPQFPGLCLLRPGNGEGARARPRSRRQNATRQKIRSGA
jgi:hypothetical protein